MSRRLKLSAVASIAAALSITAGMLAMSSVGASTGASTFKDGPYPSHSQDSGTCGPNWAVDLYTRSFKVVSNLDSTFSVTETFASGRFITRGSGTNATNPVTTNQSPGACEAGAPFPNGTIKTGVLGTFSGTYSITVPAGASFNQNGSCNLNADGECDTAGWMSGFFSPSTYNLDHFHFAYNAPAATVAAHWVNADTGNTGDIATGNPTAGPVRHATHSVRRLPLG